MNNLNFQKNANKEVTTHTIIIIDHSHDYYLTVGCVFIVYVILLKLKQVYNMSRSQRCPLCCRSSRVCPWPSSGSYSDDHSHDRERRTNSTRSGQHKPINAGGRKPSGTGYLTLYLRKKRQFSAGKRVIYLSILIFIVIVDFIVFKNVSAAEVPLLAVREADKPRNDPNE